MSKSPAKRHLIIPACLLALLPAAARAVAPYTPDISGNWHVVYDNEFNDNSTATDLAGWTYDIGNGSGGWGNNEQEYYRSNAANVSVSTSNGVGALHIDAIKQSYDGYSYTSGRIESTNAFNQTFGVIEFRAELPSGTGLWPAVWMLPSNATGSSSPLYGGWPNSGEVDILESLGQSPTLIQGSLHTGTAWNTTDNQTGTYPTNGKSISTNTWHTYDLEWDNGSPGTFKWYVDGVLYETQTGGWVVPSNAPAGDKEAPFDQPFHLLINLAVGGNYDPGDAVSLTSGVPYDMAIDYIRSYEPYVLGDTNNDGIVNTTDLNTIKANLGKKLSGGYSVGDFNGDGVVNEDDVSLYELGLTEQNGGAGSAPEPGYLIFSALPLIALRRRRDLVAPQ